MFSAVSYRSHGAQTTKGTQRWVCATEKPILEESGVWINTLYDIIVLTQNHLLYLLAERQFSTCKLIIGSSTPVNTKREGGHQHFQHPFCAAAHARVTNASSTTARLHRQQLQLNGNIRSD